jgi:hypothetical protein
VIYRDLIASEVRTRQVITDVVAALARGRNCLVLTSWIAHLQRLADGLRAAGHDPVVLRGGMGAKDRAAAIARLRPQPGGPPLTFRLYISFGPFETIQQPGKGRKVMRSRRRDRQPALSGHRRYTWYWISRGQPRPALPAWTPVFQCLYVAVTDFILTLSSAIRTTVASPDPREVQQTCSWRGDRPVGGASGIRSGGPSCVITSWPARPRQVSSPR